jgi:hypothetical protein
MSTFIIDDEFLSIDEINAIGREFYRLPAIFSPLTSYVPEEEMPDPTDKYSNRFMYCSYENDENFTKDLAIKVLEKFSKKHKIDYDTIERTRSNTTFLCNEHRPSVPHVDSPNNHLVLLYYIDDSDGDTVLYKNNYYEDSEMIADIRISPKAGRAVLFDGRIYHSFYYPNIYDKRSVININLTQNGGKNA